MKNLMTAVMLLCVLPLFAQDQKKGDFGLALGYMFEGELYLAFPNEYRSVGETILFHAQYDYYLAGKFAVGGFYTLGFPFYGGEEISNA
jgi:hypothetical protein